MARRTISRTEDLRYAETVASVRPPSPAPRTRADSEESEPALCDACNTPLDLSDVEEQGKGVFLWVRGDQRRYDEVPLCPNCGTAIGMAVLARYAMEEDEG